MLWGIDRPEWIQLWSGTVGALVAAVLSAFVALMVVRLSNRHQSRLIRDGREADAIAEFVAAAEAFEFGVKYSDVGPAEAVIPFRAAYFRFQQASPDLAPVAAIVSPWPFSISRLAMVAVRLETKRPDLAKRCTETFSGAVSTLSVALPGWRSTPEDKRSAVLLMLNETEADLNACLDAVAEFDAATKDGSTVE